MHPTALWPLLALAAAPAAAQAPACGRTAEVALICLQADDGAKATLVRTELPARGGCAQAQVERFAAGDLDRPRSLALAAGQTGECRFASGRTLRVRLQQESGPLLGSCSADAATRFSMWVDGRKLIGGHSVRERCETASAPWSYRLEGEIVYDCSKPDGCAGWSGPDQTLSSLPVDTIEYPPDAPGPAPGRLERLLDRGPVCAEVERELAASWSAFDAFGRRPSPGPIQRLNAGERQADAVLPGGLGFAYGGARVDEFDFDNDGRIDRVYSSASDGQGGWYYAPMLVLSGASAESFVAADGTDAIHAVPCQWDAARPALSQCDDLRHPEWSDRRPPTQSVPAPLPGIAGGDEFFRTRYTTALPFRYDGTTYVALASAGTPSRDYVGIYRPRPGGAREAVCLIRRVPANM
ncbi:hypothetical protein ABU614_09870 [Lysobacter firmicutimachus]|uniref:DUF1566 domain-containing protein n=1 Tax=Lysobacter firmicutimachus TaxID=1792846 RepID=A0AAU8N0R9_9GAMM